MFHDTHPNTSQNKHSFTHSAQQVENGMKSTPETA